MQFTHSVLFSENSKKLTRVVSRQVGESDVVVTTTDAHLSPHEVLMAEDSYSLIIQNG